MNQLDFPVTYKSELVQTQEFNLNKYAFTIENQIDNVVTLRFNYPLIKIYKGNSFSLITSNNDKYFGFVESVNNNNSTCNVVICYDKDILNLPVIIKVEYYQWWSNTSPAAVILDYIFIKE